MYTYYETLSYIEEIRPYNDESLKASTTDVWHNWAKNELNGTYFIDRKSKGPD